MRKCSIFILFGLVTASFDVNAFDYRQALPEKPIAPASNPVTAEKVLLGKTLFFDPRLSKNGDVSCNSCHNLAMGGDDDGAVKHMAGRNIQRSAPSVWNVAYMSTYYWDARVTSLEAQTVDHLLDPNIMAFGHGDTLVGRLSAIPGYQNLFNAAFGESEISMENIAMAMASFERTLIVPNSRFDQYIKGDKKALNKQEKRGLEVFTEKGCLSCHFGTNMAGPAPGPGLKMGEGFYELFPNNRGSYYEKKYDFVSDLGRYHVTLQQDHKLMWRVPSLRNITDTAPYFHNGAVKDLHQAVRIMSEVQFAYPITDEEVNDIVAFLKTLTGVYPEITLPRLPDTSGKSLID